MSATPPCTPIHNINEDVLLYIFAVNADMFADTKALYTTRITSQVCREWRDMMLNAPSLWARLIDMDAVHQSSTPRWWNELMKRSGTALLWIRVHDFLGEPTPTDPSKFTKSVFADILHENWDRIEKLVMNLIISDAPELPSWETFSRPAPVLETFDVTFVIQHPVEVPDYTVISPPFSGYAPMLRRFKFPFEIIDEHVPWLNRLHSMELFGMYSVHLALKMLSSTHRLQELKIGYLHPSEETFTRMPIVSLPNLKFLEYTGHPSVGATFLDHIEIPLDCHVHIPHCHGELPHAATEEQCHSILTTYFRYAQRHLKSLEPSRIRLSINAFYCIIVRIHAKSEIPVDAPLLVSIPLHKKGDTSVPFTILETLSLHEFSCVTYLKLHYIGDLNPALGSFFCFFTSLRTIWGNGETFESLAALQNYTNTTKKQPILFPLLEAVILNGYYDSLGSSAGTPVNQAAAFILSRTRYGHPISTLHLPYYDESVAPNLAVLTEEAKGLKVLYTRTI